MAKPIPDGFHTVTPSIVLSNSKEAIEFYKKAFDARNTAQYYVDRIVAKEDVDFIISQAPLLFNKSKEILSEINEKNIKEIRKSLS